MTQLVTKIRDKKNGLALLYTGAAIGEKDGVRFSRLNELPEIVIGGNKMEGQPIVFHVSLKQIGHPVNMADQLYAALNDIGEFDVDLKKLRDTLCVIHRNKAESTTSDRRAGTAFVVRPNHAVNIYFHGNSTDRLIPSDSKRDYGTIKINGVEEPLVVYHHPFILGSATHADSLKISNIFTYNDMAAAVRTESLAALPLLETFYKLGEIMFDPLAVTDEWKELLKQPYAGNNASSAKPHKSTKANKPAHGKGKKVPA